MWALWRDNCHYILIDWLSLNLKFPQLSIFCVLFFYQSGRAALHICAERGHLEVAKELLEHKAYVNAKSKVRLYIKDVHYLVHSKNLICSTDGEEPLWYTFPVTHPFVDDVTKCQSDAILTILWVCTHSKYCRRKDVRLRLLASKKPPSINAWRAFHLITPGRSTSPGASISTED